MYFTKAIIQAICFTCFLICFEEEFRVDISNIMFEVKTLTSEMTLAATSTSNVQAPQSKYKYVHVHIH